MRRNEPSLEEGLEDYYTQHDWYYSDDYEYEYNWVDLENWEWWLEQVDYDAVNEILGEDYLY